MSEVWVATRSAEPLPKGGNHAAAGRAGRLHSAALRALFTAASPSTRLPWPKASASSEELASYTSSTSYQTTNNP